MLTLKDLINATLQFIKPQATVNSGVVTSPYTVRIQNAVIRCGMCTLTLAVNNGGANFANGRIGTLATLAEGYRPAFLFNSKAVASNGINSFANRTASMLIQPNGNIIIDNHGNTDVKEIFASITYVLGGGSTSV